MATLQFTIDAKEDGQTLPGFPLIKSVTVTESRGRSTFVRTPQTGFFELGLGELDTVTVLLVQADQATTLRFNDQTDAGLPMSANAVLLLIDTAIPSGATSKASIENDSGSNATVIQVAAGS